jgi:hypothetical protein
VKTRNGNGNRNNPAIAILLLFLRSNDLGHIFLEGNGKHKIGRYYLICCREEAITNENEM